MEIPFSNGTQSKLTRVDPHTIWDVPHSETNAPYLEVFVDLVSEITEEVVSILLLSHVDRLSPQFECLPEVVGSVELQLAL